MTVTRPIQDILAALPVSRYLPMTIAELHVLRADLPGLDFRGVEVAEMSPVSEEEEAYGVGSNR